MGLLAHHFDLTVTPPRVLMATVRVGYLFALRETMYSVPAALRDEEHDG